MQSVSLADRFPYGQASALLVLADKGVYKISSLLVSIMLNKGCSARKYPQGKIQYIAGVHPLMWFKQSPGPGFAVGIGIKAWVDHAMVERRIKDRLLVVRSSFTLFCEVLCSNRALPFISLHVQNSSFCSSLSRL